MWLYWFPGLNRSGLIFSKFQTLTPILISRTYFEEHNFHDVLSCFLFPSHKNENHRSNTQSTTPPSLPCHSTNTRRDHTRQKDTMEETNNPDTRPAKQGHICCGFCCDMRWVFLYVRGERWWFNDANWFENLCRVTNGFVWHERGRQVTHVRMMV